MPPVAAPARVLFVALAGEALCLARATVGVAPEDRGRYDGAQFSCLDGRGGPFPISSVNDEFCDCADGSDEPGTGACAGQTTTVFFCRNEGSTPRRLYASRVGDGICDCCDGSDEASLAARQGGASSCVNTCAEQGREEQEANKRRIAELSRAMAAKDEAKKTALLEREKFDAEIKVLEVELPALQETLDALKGEADKEREIKKKKEEEEKKRKDEEEKKKQEELSKLEPWGNEACMWRQTGGCGPEGVREESNDKKCTDTIAKGSSGFCDCDGDGKWASDGIEPGYKCNDDGPETCSLACRKAEKASGENAEAAKAGQPAGDAEGDEKPQISEYTKWMDGAADKLSEDGEKAKEEEKPQVSEYAKWMDGGEDKMKERDAEGRAAPAADAATTTTTTQAGKSAIDKEREARSKVDAHKDKIQEIKDKTGSIPDSHLGYFSLVGKTLQKRVAEFNYEINFFTDAIQDSTQLGKFEEWTGPRQAVFDKGTRCWGGPDRKLIVNFQCGEEPALIDAMEPSRCVYEATVVHPGACEEEDLKALTAGTRVIAAHEEL